MKLKKLMSAISVSVAAATVFSLSASAYEINKDLKTGWSINATVPGDEFADLTTDSVVTITYTADASLADVDGQNYWCIKPMINDSGWPFIDCLVGAGITLSDGGDSYTVAVDATEIKFTVPDEEIVEHIQIAGIAIIGHGITLGSLTVSNTEKLPDPVVTEAAPEETEAAPAETEAAPAETEAAPAETEAAPAETEAAPAETEAAPAATEAAPAETEAAPATTAAPATSAAPAAGNVAAATDSSKGSPDTGIADVAAIAGLAIVAGGAVLVAKKRK